MINNSTTSKMTSCCGFFNNISKFYQNKSIKYDEQSHLSCSQSQTSLNEADFKQNSDILRNLIADLHRDSGKINFYTFVTQATLF